MAGLHHATGTRARAIADYRESGDILAVVAARHGVGRSTLGAWVNGCADDELAYVGGWETRGGVKYPLFPERRSA